MRIIVNHLTRMTNPRICVAGIDVDTYDHVRPTTHANDLITRAMLREHGGPFGVGALVDLGPVEPRPTVPESARIIDSSRRERGASPTSLTTTT